jgi:protein-disulfide isomerase
MKKHYIILISIVCLIFTFIAGIYLYKTQQNKKIGFLANENASTFIRKHSQTYGSDTARVFLVEFFDPACETCRTFYPLVKKLLANHSGKLKLVMRYAPFHQGADEVVKILEAARKQDKYWETLEILYKYQPYWASHHNPQPELIWKYLPEAGVNIKQIKADMASSEIMNIIKQDMADAKTLNVRKTPSFFVNGKPLTSFGYIQLKDLITSEIKAVYEKQ